METTMIYSKVISITTVGYDKTIDFYNWFMSLTPDNGEKKTCDLGFDSVVDTPLFTCVDAIHDKFSELPSSSLKRLIAFIIFKNDTPMEASSGIELIDMHPFKVEDFSSVLKAVYLDPSQHELQLKLLPLLESLLPQFSQFKTPILSTDPDFANAALTFYNQLSEELFRPGSLDKFKDISHQKRLLDLLHFSRLVQFDDSSTTIFLNISNKILQLTLGRLAYHDDVSSVLYKDINGVIERKDMRNAVLFLGFLQNSLPHITDTKLAKNWKAIYNLFNPLLLRPSITRVSATTRLIHIGDGYFQSKSPLGKVSSERKLSPINASILMLVDRYLSDIHRYFLGPNTLGDLVINAHDKLIGNNNDTYLDILQEYYFNKHYATKDPHLDRTSQEVEFFFPRRSDNPFFKQFRDSLLDLKKSTTLKFPDKPTRFLLASMRIFIFESFSVKPVQYGIFFPNFNSGTTTFSTTLSITLPPPLIITFDSEKKAYYLAINCEFAQPPSP